MNNFIQTKRKVQPVSYKRFFRCNNCFLLLVYTINLSLSTYLIETPPMGTLYMKHTLYYFILIVSSLFQSFDLYPNKQKYLVNPFIYTRFHKTIPRSRAIVKWISVCISTLFIVSPLFQSCSPNSLEREEEVDHLHFLAANSLHLLHPT